MVRAEKTLTLLITFHFCLFRQTKKRYICIMEDLFYILEAIDNHIIENGEKQLTNYDLAEIAGNAVELERRRTAEIERERNEPKK